MAEDFPVPVVPIILKCFDSSSDGTTVPANAISPTAAALPWAGVLRRTLRTRGRLTSMSTTPRLYASGDRRRNSPQPMAMASGRYHRGDRPRVAAQCRQCRGQCHQ